MGEDECGQVGQNRIETVDAVRSCRQIENMTPIGTSWQATTRVFVCVLSVEARNGTTCRAALCTCGGIDGKKDLLCMHNKAFRIEFKI